MSFPETGPFPLLLRRGGESTLDKKLEPENIKILYYFSYLPHVNGNYERESEKSDRDQMLDVNKNLIVNSYYRVVLPEWFPSNGTYHGII